MENYVLLIEIQSLKEEIDSLTKKLNEVIGLVNDHNHDISFTINELSRIIKRVNNNSEAIKNLYNWGG